MSLPQVKAIGLKLAIRREKFDWYSRDWPELRSMYGHCVLTEVNLLMAFCLTTLSGF